MRLLGIDLGSSSVKAVELDSAFGRFEIHEYHEHPIEPGTDRSQALSALMASLSKTPDRIAVTLRTGQLTFRNLQLPTRDKKAIHAGVGFELDDELPFSIDDAAYDYSALSQTGQISHVHVAATLAKNVDSLVTELQNVGVDPDLVTTEAWALRTLLNRSLGTTAQEKPVMLICIGHRYTILHVQWHGFPVFTRELNWGGLDLTTEICRKLEIPIQQAEKLKINPGETPLSVILEASLQQGAMKDLISELKQAELVCRSITHEPISDIYCTGPSTQLQGLVSAIEGALSHPVRPIKALSSISPAAMTYSEQTDSQFALASGLALCLLGSGRTAPINFRKGQFSKSGRGGRETSLAAFKKPLVALGTIAATLFISLNIESNIYRSKIEERDRQLKNGIRSLFGSVSDSAIRTYLTNTSTLKSSIQKEVDKQRETAHLYAPNPHSPLQFLNNLSAGVPRDVVVDMTQFQVGSAPTTSYSNKEPGSVTLTFLLKEQQAAQRLSGLLQSKLLSGPPPSEPQEVIQKDGGKRFRVTYSGTATEDAFKWQTETH